MEQYNLYYFTEFTKPIISKEWSIEFVEAINLIKPDEIPKTFEIAPKNSKSRRIYSNQWMMGLSLVLHRKNGPAIEKANGDKEWYINDKLHREDGPAIECADGDKYWYINGKRHREDGPVIEWDDGTKMWYINGKRHREDGPAVEWANGGKEWYINGEIHRKDGPAVEWILFKKK